jgi:hypothetical protein
MKTVYAFAFFTGISAVIFAQSAAFQQNRQIRSPFTLEITANLDRDHSNRWDFANSAESTVRAGSTIVVAIRKTNTSDQDISRWGVTGQVIEVRDSNGNFVSHRQSDSMQGSVRAMRAGTNDPVLKPGESDVRRGRLSEGYDMSQPGTYTVQISEHISDDPGSNIVKSNIIAVTVLPKDEPAPK